MFDYLDKLRAKPVHVRQRIALFATGTLSLFVAVVWVGTLNTERPTPTVSAVAEANTRSPWGVVVDMLKNTKGEMTAAVSEATAQLEEVTAGSVTYDPSTDVGSITDDAAPLNEDAEVWANDEVSAFPDTPGAETAGEVVHTRPRSWEEATGTTSGNNMIQ
jgi:hypothetical protein